MVMWECVYYIRFRSVKPSHLQSMHREFLPLYVSILFKIAKSVSSYSLSPAVGFTFHHLTESWADCPFCHIQYLLMTESFIQANTVTGAQAMMGGG